MRIEPRFRARSSIELDITLQPKQQLLLDAIQATGADVATVIGFGGARGSAKSGGVRRIALTLATSEPCIIWIIRRVWDDLNKDHVLPLWDEYPDLRQFWHAGEKKLVIPLGAGKTSTIFFIHAGIGGRSKRKARGPQARYIFVEQAEEFSQEEMEQLAGSNREKGVGPGVCKRIYTFNPGGIGTAYLRRVFHLRQYMDNEEAKDFLFIQGFGWDNYEWFRYLGMSAEAFYAMPEQARFDLFLTTDFGDKLNKLPPAQRIGELMGSFDQFGGQYYIDVWEQSVIVLDPALVATIVQPWWVRWLATDWGYSHYAATYWATSGVLAPAVVLQHFGVECSTPIRLIIVYREFVCQDTAEPELAAAIAKMTPETERRQVRGYWLSPDAWAKGGGGNTVQEQIQAVITREGLPEIEPAKTDRVGGWRLLYNCWAMARKLRRWSGPVAFEQRAEDPPCLFISASCPELVKSVPMLICDEKDPTDIRKIPGAVEDDCADACFVADTMISCARGDVPISEVVAGDRVWTRDGLRAVTNAWCSGRKPVVRAVFDNDSAVVCTHNHRFFTRGRGFVRLDGLRYCDELVTWNQLYMEVVSTARCRELQEAGFADVYDLEVEDGHEFFANGILVHNCRYLLKSYLDAEPKPPDDIVRRQVYDSYQDPTSRAMAMRRLEAEQSKGRYLQRRGRA